jgi:7-cyano-7-deazaguanine synthase
VSGFHVTYGQAAAHREGVAAQAIANHYQIPLTIVTLGGAYSKSDGEIRGRNAFLIFTALMELEAINPTVLAIGIHSSTSYYDCSPGFLYAIQAIVDGLCDGCFRVAAPFLDWTKSEIWAYCIKHRIPVDLTYSCEMGLDQPCGLCLSCRDLEALRAL